MELQINVDEAIATITRNFALLSKKGIAAGTAAAINRSLTTGRAEGEKQIRSNYNIKKDVLSDAFKIKKATSLLQIGEIKASTQAISLSHFSPTFSFTRTSKTSYNKKGVAVTRILKRQSKDYGKGVTVEIIKGHRVSVPYAFMIAGKKPVFARGAYEKGGKYGFIKRNKRVNKTGQDSPITSLVNISAYSSIVNDRVMPGVNIKVSNAFTTRLEHELNYRLSRMR